MYSNSLKSIIIKNKYEFEGTEISPGHKQVI